MYYFIEGLICINLLCINLLGIIRTDSGRSLCVTTQMNELIREAGKGERGALEVLLDGFRGEWMLFRYGCCAIRSTLKTPYKKY